MLSLFYGDRTAMDMFCLRLLVHGYIGYFILVSLSIIMRDRL